jgi:histidinol-phosphate phosphatase family domain/HAD-superfamily hydrolase, subfamily IIIA
MERPLWSIDHTWTLFLDRDGVINQRIPSDYVKSWEDFHFCKGSLESIVHLSSHFGRIIVVTNQQGIGKGLMEVSALEDIHQRLKQEITQQGGRLDAIYYCPDLANTNSTCRKPKPGMAWQAKSEFPGIDFHRSLMVGDSISDMAFAKQLEMKTVFIEGKLEEEEQSRLMHFDLRLAALAELPPLLVYPEKRL